MHTIEPWPFLSQASRAISVEYPDPISSMVFGLRRRTKQWYAVASLNENWQFQRYFGSSGGRSNGAERVNDFAPLEVMSLVSNRAAARA